MGFDFGQVNGKRFSQNSWVADENVWSGPSATPIPDLQPLPIAQPRNFLDRLKDFGSGIGSGLRKVAEPYRNESINMFDVVLKDPSLKESDRIKYQAKKDALLKPGFQPSNTSGNIGDAVGQLVGNAPAFAFGGAATEGIAKGVLGKLAPKISPKLLPWADTAVKGGLSFAAVAPNESNTLQEVPERVAKNFALGAGMGVGFKGAGIALKPVGNAIGKGVDSARSFLKPLGVPSAPIQPTPLRTLPVASTQPNNLGGPLNRFEVKADQRVPGTAIPKPVGEAPIADPTITPTTARQQPSIGEPKIVNERRFSQNVRDSQVAPESVKQNTLENPLTYEPITNKETLNKANIEVATDAVKARQKFNAPSKGISADDVALGESLIVKAIKDGDTVGANELIADLAEKLTQAGQAVQAASIFKRLTPEGMLLYAQRTVNTVNKNLLERLGKKAPKVELTPEDSKFIIDTMTRVQKLADGREKDIAMAQVKKLISEKMPASLASKVAALQRISLLLNPKTMVRNTLGNTVFGVIDNIANTVATPIDMLASKAFKTPRTTTLPSPLGQLKSMAQGAKITAQDAKLGIDTYNTKTQYEFSGTRNFNNKILHKLDRATIVGLKMGDTPFHKASFDDSLRQQMKLAKVDKPTLAMEKQAQKTADQRTYQDVNALTDAFKMIQKSLNKISSAFHLGNEDFGLGNLVVPFVKTPANILKRALEYSPVGITDAIKEATKIGKGKFDQKVFVDSISRSATGTALIMVGYDLAKRGMITGSGNKDKDVAAFERGLGKNDYAYKYGDNLYTYDWMQPGSMAIAIGADVYLKGKDRKQAENVVLDAAKSGGETLFKQSLLQGVTRFMSGYNPMDSIAKTVINSPTQFIPTVAKQISQTQDPTQRTTYSPDKLGTAGNLLKARIPGMTTSLEPKINTSGEAQQTFQGKNTISNIFLNPGSATTYKPNEVQKGILDLYEKTGDVTIFPRVAPKSFTYKGDSIKLTPQEMTSYQQTLGKVTEARMKPILADKKTDNDKKVEELKAAIDKANEDAKIELLQKRGIEYKK